MQVGIDSQKSGQPAGVVTVRMRQNYRRNRVRVNRELFHVEQQRLTIGASIKQKSGFR